MKEYSIQELISIYDNSLSGSQSVVDCYEFCQQHSRWFRNTFVDPINIHRFRTEDIYRRAIVKGMVCIDALERYDHMDLTFEDHCEIWEEFQHLCKVAPEQMSILLKDPTIK